MCTNLLAHTCSSCAAPWQLLLSNLVMSCSDTDPGSSCSFSYISAQHLAPECVFPTCTEPLSKSHIRWMTRLLLCSSVTLFLQFLVCKRKLESKKEALLILSKELDTCQQERDQYKLMANQLRERHQGLKKKYRELIVRVSFGAEPLVF